jgi:purine-nucleoside phosphorylase
MKCRKGFGLCKKSYIFPQRHHRHMSIHLSAKPGEIARIVLMPGDPLRARYIAESMLEDAALVSRTRNNFYYTGLYKGTLLTVGASGMGCPSMGIYSYELYTQYNVDCIIRIGTCGAYTSELKLFDLINAHTAYSESTYAKCAFDFDGDHFPHQGKAYDVINDTATTLNIPLRTGPIHSGDAFYTTGKGLPSVATSNHCLVAEMEAFALFANAKQCKKMAATLLTVSDNIVTRQIISADERERSLDMMAKLALEAAFSLAQVQDAKNTE